MNNAFFIYTFVINSAYLIKSPLKISSKITILQKYVFLMVAKTRILRIKKITIQNFKIVAFDEDALVYLFGEIFVKNIYYFDAKNDSPVIIDCGSNIGVSILYFKYLYPNAIIYGFEPDKTTYELLQKNIQVNKLNQVHLYNYAVSNKDGELSFYIDESPGNLTMSAIKGRISKKEVKVKQISLANFIKNTLPKNKKVDLLKMDIEGYEDIAIDDLYSKKTLKNINEMIIEYHLNIEGTQPKLGAFLYMFEKSDYRYTITMDPFPIFKSNTFQDVVLHLKKQRK